MGVLVIRALLFEVNIRAPDWRGVVKLGSTLNLTVGVASGQCLAQGLQGWPKNLNTRTG